MGRAHEVRAASMAKTAAMKSKLYAKYSKEILIAAKSGVPDPNSNLTLRRAIDKAKANQVPSDVIKRAIEKASSSSAENYIFNTYEGFGPGASTLIIESLTDNPNRAIAEIRACFNKCHSKLGVSGSVSFNYTHCSVVSIKGASENEVEEALILNDANFYSAGVCTFSGLCSGTNYGSGCVSDNCFGNSINSENNTVGNNSNDIYVYDFWTVEQYCFRQLLN